MRSLCGACITCGHIMYTLCRHIFAYMWWRVMHATTIVFMPQLHMIYSMWFYALGLGVAGDFGRIASTLDYANPPIQHSNFRRDPTATDRILSFRVHRYAHTTYRIRAVAHSVLLVIPPTDRPTEHKTAARGFATLDKCQRKCARAVQTQTRKTNTQFTKSYHLAQHKRAYVVDTARVGSCFCVCACVCVLWMGGGWRLNHEPWSRCLHKGLGMAIGRDRDQ